MYYYIIIIVIALLYYCILKKYGNKEIKSIESINSPKSIESKSIDIKSIDIKSVKNKIDLELSPPPSYEEVEKDTKKSKYKLCPFFNT